MICCEIKVVIRYLRNEDYAGYFFSRHKSMFEENIWHKMTRR